MITKEYGIGLRKQAAALREQADALEKQAAAGAVIKPALNIAGKLAAKIGAPTSKLAGKTLINRAMSAAKAGSYKPTTGADLAINRVLTAIRNNPKAVGVAETAVGAIGAGSAAAAALKDKPAEEKKPETVSAVKDESLPVDNGGNDATDYSYPEKKDGGVSPNLITGGATAAGGILGGILGNTLAPEKYKKLMTAIGAITGAAISGAGAHYGQKALNA